MRATSRFSAAVAGIAAVVACATSQQAAAKQRPDSIRKTGQFTLPAGLHRMDELAQRLAMMRKKVLTLDEESRALLHKQQVRVYGEMQLPQDALEDVLSSMLLTGGVVIGHAALDRGDSKANAGTAQPAKAPSATTLTAFPLASAGERPVPDDRSPKELLERPSNAALVTTLASTGALNPMMAKNVLRPMLAAATFGPAALELQVSDGKLRLRGPTDYVVYAIRLLNSVADPEGFSASSSRSKALGPASAKDGDAARGRWPGGKSRLSEIGKLASESAQLTLVRREPAGPADAAKLDPVIDMGPAGDAMLSKQAWLARLSSVLADSDIPMTPLALEHGVFEIHTEPNPKRKHYQQTRAILASPEQVLAKQHKLFVMTLEPISVAPNVAANMLRPFAKDWPGTCFGSFSRTHIMLSGRRDYIAKAIQILRDNK